MVGHLHYQLSLWKQIILLYSSTGVAPQFLKQVITFIEIN